MISRRQVVLGLGAGAISVPLAALAQQPGGTRVIGYLAHSNPEPAFSLFKDELRKLGYIDGNNIRIEFRNADANPERLAGLAAELIRFKVHILVTLQTPAATAAKQATSQIPIVMSGVGDPVGTGLISSLARPGGNITGTSGTTAESAGKLLELIRELIPKTKRVAVLANSADPFTKSFLRQILVASHTMSIEISSAMIRETAEFGAAFADIVKRRADAVIVQPSLQRKVAVEFALKHRIPLVSPTGAFPDEGGLMSYSANVADLHREAAVYVDKILKGAKPADLPVQEPTKFELNINLKTAKALGIKIPRSVLLRADRVIE